MAVKAIPDGYHSLTPYLVMKEAGRALDFYKKALGATEIMRMPGPGGRVMHAEMRLGDSVFMMADESPERGYLGPQSIGGTPVSIMLYVDEVDAVFAQAIASGATEMMGVQDQFYGDRSGTFKDPFGHVWTVATHKEDVSPEEMKRRMAAMGPQG